MDALIKISSYDTLLDSVHEYFQNMCYAHELIKIEQNCNLGIYGHMEQFMHMYLHPELDKYIRQRIQFYSD